MAARNSRRRDSRAHAAVGRAGARERKWNRQFALGLSPVAPKVQRVSDLVISERDRLQHFLDQQRNAVLAIVDGLDETQVNTPVLPSGWTPIGLVRQLASAEALGSKGWPLGHHCR